MYTIAETPSFAEDAKALWAEEERAAFCVWLAGNPEAGDVIPGSGGCRKVRWSRAIFSNPFVRPLKMTDQRSSTDSMTGEELGLKLLQSVRQMKAGQTARVTRVAPNEVADARQQTGLTQAQFAQALCISRRTLQEWEQGRRAPSGAAQALIRIARKHPEVLLETLA
ncbi:helix-turn-helix domain-containing protein [Amphibiibacter pelophylacis]|uniref:Helix-turn-helix domain-containing protein n=1 Tax=Amphibiibacter pelophylacis TaxID=1799477 RepID=A0ACC6NYC3_9BURK